VARSLVAAISLKIENTQYFSQTNFSIPAETWWELNSEARIQANVDSASWNPLLQSDTERKAFEAFARTPGAVDEGLGVPCYICDDPSKRVSNRDQLVEVSCRS